MDISITTSKCYNKKEGKINVKKGTTMTKTVQKSKARDMTQGSIWKQLLLFSLPLMAGNLFQQLYNTVDSIVVGNFVGKEALAAVGSVGPIINSLIGFFMGLSTGAGVIISQYYGAKADEKVSRTVSTTLVMTFILSIVFTILGILITPYMLRMMSTPDDVIRESATYLKIYFGGVAGLMFYNMGSGVLRAVGDSRHPLYFLIFSAVVNTVLDLLFVVSFGMGIEGVALATVIAQCLSAVLTLYVLTTTDGPYRICWKKLCMDWSLLYRIVCVGLPAAIQQMVTSVSNVFVQSYINVFGSDVMAGWSACMKIDQFMMLPMMSVGLASTTFTGQNVGASYIDRAKKGATTAFLLAELVTIVMMIPLLIFAPQMVYLFNQEAAVIRYGTLFLYLLSPFYILCCVNQVYSNVLRGAGDTRTPMIVMLGSFVVFRQIYLFVMSHIFDSIIPIALGYPAGWLVCSVLILSLIHI